VSAQDPDPADWDLELRLEEADYAAGDTLTATAGVVARADGVQGWSYGVKHDPNVLDIISATSEGTDVGSVFNGGFDQTTIVPDPVAEPDETKVGYFQAIVLSFLEEATVPVSDYFRMSAAEYKVKDDICEGREENFTTKLEFTSDLSLKPDDPESPKIEINLTIGGIGIVPEKIVDAEPTIMCAAAPEGLVLKFDKTDTDLVADQTSIYDLKVLIENADADGQVEILGWSYGVTIDPDELVPTEGMPGDDAAGFHGGDGPEFVNYNLEEQDLDGNLNGITVGVVISLNPPATESLSLPAGSPKHVDTIKLRSKQTIGEGEPSRTTIIGFSDALGGDRPVEVIFTDDNGDSLIPDFTDTLELTLLGGIPTEPRFIRGDSNNDAKVDISDGIWIINELFYAGPETVCKPAADSNADDKVDLADAMYIFNYRLQPGATSDNLFPAPSAPFPDCGTADDATVENCPMGSTTCMQ
jgi:hypothetical protein